MADIERMLNYYSRIYQRLIFIVVLISSTIELTQAQGIRFNPISWEQAVQQANYSNKLIFVDFYTDWCAPCKMMDRDIYVDALLGKIYNEHFITLKINADKEPDLINEYNVRSYPTLMFLQTDGSVIWKYEGALSAQQLISTGKQLIEYQRLTDHDELKNIDPNTHSLQEIEHILKASNGFHFEGKVFLAQRLLHETNTISDETLELTMDQLEYFDQPTLQLLAPMVAGFLPSQVLHDRIGRKKIKWRNQLLAMIDHRIHQAIRNDDFDEFQKQLYLHQQLNNLHKKDIDRLTLMYYRNNDWQKYATFAENYIDKYIVSATVEELQEEDRRRYQLFKTLEQNQQNNLSEQSNISNDQEPPGKLEQYYRIYNICESRAEMLFEISSDFYAFYSDPVLMHKAEQWAAKAYYYFPYHVKYYENHIVILEALDNYSAIAKVDMLLRENPYYEEMKLHALSN